LEGGAAVLLADGYNIIMAWENAREMELSHAREALIERMDNYAGATGVRCILVFDGHRVEGNPGSVTAWDTMEVVYTRTGQSADGYIERACYELTEQGFRVAVVSGDGMIQSLALGMGALRVTPREFLAQMENTAREVLRRQPASRERNGLLGRADAETLAILERMRRE
jgi:predicted RNA-binding protein with PIN domain